MANGHKQEITRLERKVTDLYASFRRLADDRELKELIDILHRPGWTTPAELRFATAIADGMSAHVNAIAAMKGEFIKASAAVEVGEVAVSR
jgi:hypothetical protein